LASETDRYLAEAALAAFNAKFDRAIEIYTEGLAQNTTLKERSELLRMRGATFDLSKRPEQAEADFNEVVKLIGDSDPRAYSIRGRFYYHQNRWDESLADYRNGARLFPGDGIFPHGEGLSLTNQGKFAEAIDRLSEAIKLDPTSSAFFLGRAEAYNRSHQPEKALEDYNTSLALAPPVVNDIARLRTGRGYALNSLKKYSAAIDDFNVAIEHAPGRVNAIKWRGFAFEQMGETRQAIRDYEIVMKLRPSEVSLAKRIEWLQEKLATK
jgi:tetratricopeptide (TPR) repeat protein